jgi:D-beta-D-heptose 7-phosphate kinase/D-beta-D-heptose 1-phosphate adenosyltransferase
VHVKGNEERPGGAANVALNIAHLGGKATLLGYIGADEAGVALQTHLENKGVDAQLICLEHKPTITKLRIMSRHQQLMRLDFEEDFKGEDHSELTHRYQTLLEKTDVVVFSDYRKGCLENSRELIAMAHRLGKTIIVDPKSADFSDYAQATLLTPNLSEFTTAAGTWKSEAELLDKARAVLSQHHIENLLITRSEQGMSLIQAQADPIHLPTQARDVFDVTGAGDTVVAVLAASCSAGLHVQQAMVLANLAAGIVVAKVGTATVSQAELEQSLNQYSLIAKGVVSETQLIAAVRDAQAHGKKIVMTNGCFDLLHSGHVSYLEQAKALGDRLIVAVNTDASVRRLKGETRPINCVENRMKVLSALESVDWVLPFGEDTPQRLICAVKPNLLVKGGDNDPQNIPGNTCVWDNGGDVVVLSFVEGSSTTGTIAKIQTLPQEKS